MSQIMRQGDVLLVPATTPSETTKVDRDNGRVILAYGEVTGHAHAITDENCELVTDKQANELFLLVYGDDVALVHAEHATIVVAPGVYRVVRQREYVAENLTSQVAD